MEREEDVSSIDRNSYGSTEGLDEIEEILKDPEAIKSVVFSTVYQELMI